MAMPGIEPGIAAGLCLESDTFTLERVEGKNRRMTGSRKERGVMSHYTPHDLGI